MPPISFRRTAAYWSRDPIKNCRLQRADPRPQTLSISTRGRASQPKKQRDCVAQPDRHVGPFRAMLSPQVQYSLANAREYFRAHLSVGDYYAAAERVDGEWFGQGAEQLGLKGAVTEKQFLALCEGRHPVTGKRLTLRLNSTRHENGKEIANRRIFYDFTLSPPKSVSVVGLHQDSRIVELHNRAVRLAMVELERFAETRVRQSGQNGERVTGCVVGASFQHDTSRELDPHLHTHCLIFNATFDSVEQRWKALHATGLYRAQKFVEHYYYHELCQGLRSLGYEIKSNARDFELKHVPASIVERFSKRHRQIEEEAQRRVADGFDGNVKDLRERVAHGNRRRKLKDSTAERLRPLWARQMTAEEKTALASLRPSPSAGTPRADVAALVAWADAHLFERRAVVNDYELQGPRSQSTTLSFSKARSVAARLGICSKTLFRWADQGKITRHKINARLVLFSDAEVESFIRSTRTGC